MNLAILLLFLIANNLAYSQSSSIELERLNFVEDIAQIKLIKISNQYGDIRIRKTKQTHINYLAVSQFSVNFRAKLVTNIKDGILSLEILYLNSPPKKSLERVDVAIIVPDHVELDIIIEKGNLSSKKITNKIKARSNSSNMNIKTSNSTDLFTTNGNIQLTLIPHKEPQQSSLKTHKGNVILKYHNKQVPKIDIISGGVTTSNSINLLKNKKKIKRKTTYKPKRAFGKASIQTDTGNIQLVEIEQL